MRSLNSSLTLAALAAVTTLVVAPARSAPLIPGAILSAGYGSDEIRQYSKTGTLLDTISVTGPTSSLVGIALIGDTVWTLGVGGEAGTVDMTTGVFTPAFTVSGVFEGFASIGSDLLLLHISGPVERYTAAGAFVSGFNLPSGDTYTGIDTDGSNVYLTNFSQGTVETYTLAGAFSSSFNTGQGNGVLSALAFDDSDGTLWVGRTFNFGPFEVQHYTTGGAFLGSFAVPQDKGNGLEVVASAAPEPGTLGLLALGAVAGVAVRRSRRAR